MVTIKNRKLIIEIKTDRPVEFYTSLQKAILESVQALQIGEEIYNNPDLPDNIFYLLELQMALLLTDDQSKKSLK